MTDKNATDFLEATLTNSRRKLAICNALFAVLSAVGNALIPSYFWNVGPDSPYMSVSVFFGGMLATQIAIMGLYGGLYDQFILVRLTWATLGLVALTLFYILGLQIANSSVVNQKLDVEIVLVVAGIAMGCFIAMLAVSLAARSLWHYRLVQGYKSDGAKSKSFGIAFLMKLTTGIAGLLVGIKLLSLESKSLNLPILAFSAVVALTFILVIGLIAGALKSTLAQEGNSVGLRAVLVLLLIGSPTLVLLCRLLLPNGWSYLGQLLSFFCFLLGFICSLLTALYAWRKLGVTLVRVTGSDL